jgi:hypothetical protein
MPHIHCRWTLDPDQPVSYPAFCYLSAGPPPPVVKKKPSWKYELKNPDGTSASFLTTGYMPLLAPPEPNSPDLVMRSGVASPSSSPVNQHQCEACGYCPPTTVETGSQTDPLVFPFENQLVVLPPFVFPRGIKWTL